MAIQYKLSTTPIFNSEGTTVTLTDETGIYNVSTNPGGYGTPNPARNTKAILLLPLYKKISGDLQATQNTYNPLTVSTFITDIPIDGWYQFKMFALDLLSSVDINDEEAGDIFYNSDNNKIIRLIDIEDEDLGLIRDTEEVTLFSIKDRNEYVVATLDLFIVNNNIKTKIRVNSLINDLIFNGASFSDKKLIRYKDNYNVIRGVLEGAIYEFARSNKYVAQKNIEFLNTNDYVPE